MEGYIFLQPFEGLGSLPRSESGTVCPRELAPQPSALSLKSRGALVGCSVQISQEEQDEDDTAGGILTSLGPLDCVWRQGADTQHQGTVRAWQVPKQRAPLTAQLHCSQSQAFPAPLSRELMAL